jgi:hypothetical protein
LRRDGNVAKKIPWSAFALSDTDWARVVDAKDILAVSFRLLNCRDYSVPHQCIRIPTAFFISFRPKNIQDFIVRFLHLVFQG